MNFNLFNRSVYLKVLHTRGLLQLKCKQKLENKNILISPLNTSCWVSHACFVAATVSFKSLRDAEVPLVVRKHKSVHQARVENVQ